jgi:hypothetical protein
MTSSSAGLITFPAEDPNYYRDESASYIIKLAVQMPQEVVYKGYLPFRGIGNYVVSDTFLVEDSRGRINEEIFESPYYPSEPYLSVMTVAVASCVWHLHIDDMIWIPKLKDLNTKGRETFRLLQDVYPKCTVVLQTWIDDGFDILEFTGERGWFNVHQN